MSKIVEIAYESACTDDPANAPQGGYPAVFDTYKSNSIFVIKSAYGIVKNVTGTASVSPTGIPLAANPNVLVWNLGGVPCSIDLSNVISTYGGTLASFGMGLGINGVVLVPGQWFTATSTLSFSQPAVTTTPYPVSTNVSLVWWV